jgi:hypothetical protein
MVTRVFLKLEAVVVSGAYDFPLTVRGCPSGCVNGGLFDGAGEVPIGGFAMAGEGFQCLGGIKRAMVVFLFGGLD